MCNLQSLLDFQQDSAKPQVEIQEAVDTETALTLYEEGVSKGSTSQVSIFALVYISQGDLRSGTFLLALSDRAFSDSLGTGGVVFRALTEPGFDYDREWQKILNAYEVGTGKKFEKHDRMDAFPALAFRKYGAMIADPYSSF